MIVLLSDNERLNLFSNLSTMLRAGIPILEAIDTLNEESKGGLRSILLQVHADLNQGKSLSQSLLTFPDAFDPITVHLVTAAEEAGTLEDTLADLVLSTQKQIELTDKIKAALTYPLLVVVVFVGVILLVLTFVIPRIAAVFQRLTVQLPLPTRILMFLSDLWLRYTWIAVIGFVVGGVGMALLARYRRQQLIRLGAMLPGLSNLALMNDLANFSRSMSLLLRSGVPITQTLRLSQQVVVRKDMAAAIADAEQHVSSGNMLSLSLRAYPKLFPVVLCRLAQAGEKSGTLEKSMDQANNYFETQINKQVQRITVLLEPIMLLVIGLLVGGMMLAIIAPIYGLIGQISPR